MVSRGLGCSSFPFSARGVLFSRLCSHPVSLHCFLFLCCGWVHSKNFFFCWSGNFPVFCVTKVSGKPKYFRQICGESVFESADRATTLKEMWINIVFVSIPSQPCKVDSWEQLVCPTPDLSAILPDDKIMSADCEIPINYHELENTLQVNWFLLWDLKSMNEVLKLATK